MSSVYRWRAAFQADFAARLDWCVKPFKEANHPPVVHIMGPSSRTVKPGESIALDASSSTDPDGNGLSFQWSIYPYDSEIAKCVKFRGGETSVSRVEVSPILTGKTIPILLSVRDTGTPSLTRYERVFLRVEGAE
jgi:cellulose-binding protein